MSLTIKRPRPVLTASGVSAAVTCLAGLASWLGYTTAATQLSGLAETIGAVVITVLGVGSHALAGLHAQKRVTPMADPRGADGIALVPVTEILRAAKDMLAAHTDGPETTAPALATPPVASALAQAVPEVPAPTPVPEPPAAPTSLA